MAVLYNASSSLNPIFKGLTVVEYKGGACSQTSDQQRARWSHYVSVRFNPDHSFPSCSVPVLLFVCGYRSRTATSLVVLQVGNWFVVDSSSRTCGCTTLPSVACSLAVNNLRNGVLQYSDVIGLLFWFIIRFPVLITLTHCGGTISALNSRRKLKLAASRDTDSDTNYRQGVAAC